MRTIATSLIVALLVFAVRGNAQLATPKTDDLRKELEAIAQNFKGRLGYSLHHLKRNEHLNRLGDEMFPTDSTLKIAVMWLWTRLSAAKLVTTTCVP